MKDLNLQWDQVKSLLGISTITAFYGISIMSIWALGSILEIDTSLRIVIIICILLSAPLIMLLRSRWRRRNPEPQTNIETANETEATISKVVEPPKRYDELESKSSEVIGWLRTTRLASNAVYRLPWFLVVGTQDSGKTSLLLSSQLDFQTLPSQRTLDQDLVKPTENCHWRVSDEAIFIDTAGRYQVDSDINSKEDHEEWRALLVNIKKHRRIRPIDGLVVTINTREIFEASTSEIEKKAKLMRSRIDEVSKEMGIRFPLYLVFTHADAIEGFSTFFRTSTEDEDIAKVWGATLPLNRAGQGHNLFDSEMEHLYESLIGLRLKRLSYSSTVKESPIDQNEIFNFPLKFIEARKKLGMFSATLFKPTSFREQPLIRGFYFTSTKLKQRVNLAALTSDDNEAIDTNDEISNHPAKDFFVETGYFSQDLFKEVVLKDKEVAASFQTERPYAHLKRDALAIAAAILLLLLSIGMTFSFICNRNLISQVKEVSLSVKDEASSAKEQDPTKRSEIETRTELENVERLRQTLADLDSYQTSSPPLYLRFGLFSGNQINPYGRAIYFDSLSQRFFRETVASMEQQLQKTDKININTVTQNNQPADGVLTEMDDYYDLLKAYLMLSSMKPDRIEIDNVFLNDRLEQFWVKSVPSEVLPLARRQLDFYTSQLDKRDVPKINISDERTQFIAKARQQLLQYPPVERVLKSLVNKGNKLFESENVTLSKILRRPTLNVNGNYTVRGAYTLVGYYGFMQKAIKNSAAEMDKEDWVMGEQAKGVKNLDVNVKNLEERYFSNYIKEWQRFLRDTSITQFQNTQDAISALDELSVNDSPMVVTLSEVARNVKLSAGVNDISFLGRIKNFFGKQPPIENSKVEKEFLPLISYLQPKDEKSPVMSDYRAEMDLLSDRLSKSELDIEKLGRDLVANRDSIGLIESEKKINKQCYMFSGANKEVARLLTEPFLNLRKLLIGTSDKGIAQVWEQISNNAKILESGYPFSNSQQEVALGDLNQFLNPVDGQFTIFFKEQLSNYFQFDGSNWKVREGLPIKFTPEFISYLNNLLRLREALYPNNSAQPQFDYQISLQPTTMSVRFEIDGSCVQSSKVITNPSASFATNANATAKPSDSSNNTVSAAKSECKSSANIVWPAQGSGGGAVVTMLNPQGQEQAQAFSASGRWGLFRLVEKTFQSQLDERTFQLQWGATIMTNSRTPLQPDLKLFRQVRAPQKIVE